MKRTLSWYKKKAVTDFNMYIRLREADKNGMVTCVTCGKRLHYKEANAGHFKHGLDFVEDNQHAQCVYCNQYLSGRLDKYTIYMIDRYGRKRVDELEALANKAHKYSIPDLIELRQDFKDKIKTLISTYKERV